jgi:hypothetical protein
MENHAKMKTKKQRKPGEGFEPSSYSLLENPGVFSLSRECGTIPKRKKKKEKRVPWELNPHLDLANKIIGET